jgi:hypothetical protein
MNSVLIILGGLVVIVLVIWIQGNAIEYVGKWIDRPKKNSHD